MEYKYHERVTLGYDSNGKRVQKRIHANTKQELQRLITEAINEFESTPNPDGANFSEYGEKWFVAYKSSREKSTQNMYKRMLNKTSRIDYIRIKDIRQTDLQLIINDNAEHPRTCQMLQSTLDQVFRAAIADGIIAKNPVDNLDLPKYIASEKRALKDIELKAIKKAKLQDMDRMFVMLLFYFGLRPGEALALMPQDFDFKAGIVQIRRAVGLDDNSPYIKRTKTDNMRDIPIPNAFVKDLKKYCASLKSMYLIHNADGRLMSKSGKRRMWDRIKAEINVQLGGDDLMDLTDGLQPYTFRHNYATKLYYSGISLKKAAQLMGHEDTQMIMKVYSHLDEQKEDLTELKKMCI